MLKNSTAFFIFFSFSVGLINASKITIESKQEVLEQDLVVEEMQQRDIDKIKQLFQKSSDIASYTSMSSDFSFYLNNDGYKVYICKNKKTAEVFGFLLAIHNGNSFYIRALGVDKDYRRFGIATKLLKSAYGFAEQKPNFDTLTIHASNENARKCYEKFGFKLDSATGCLTIALIKLMQPVS